jgi:methionyl-tRNA formyltransferase
MKLAFYLMNSKGYQILKGFLNKYGADSIEYIVTAEDKNVQKDYYLEINEICKSYNLTIYNRKDELPKFNGYKLAVGWRWLIQDTSNLIVMHDSLLPKYRGFSPLVNMLINGEKEIGVTALFASENYDEGNIIMQKKVSISYPIKIQDAIKKVSYLYIDLVISIYELLINSNKLISIPQDHNQATYSLWRDEEDYMLDWEKSSSTLKRTIDAVSFPFSGAKTYLNNKIISIVDAVEVEDVVIENRDIGKVIFISNGHPVVVCGEGLLKIIEAYDSNKKSVLPLKNFRSRFEKEKKQ